MDRNQIIERARAALDRHDDTEHEAHPVEIDRHDYRAPDNWQPPHLRSAQPSQQDATDAQRALAWQKHIDAAIDARLDQFANEFTDVLASEVRRAQGNSERKMIELRKALTDVLDQVNAALDRAEAQRTTTAGNVTPLKVGASYG